MTASTSCGSSLALIASKWTVRRNSTREAKLGILGSKRWDISANQLTAAAESVKACRGAGRSAIDACKPARTSAASGS